MWAIPMRIGAFAITRGALAALLGLASVAGFAQARPGPGECPQPRFTGKAPERYYVMNNPLEPSASRIASAERVYSGKVGGAKCALCHGSTGNGKGHLASLFDPPPRNFACAQTVNGIPDGQLFWIVKYGSPGTAMPPTPELSDEQVWEMVLYLRQLAR
jgi:mono/diheme cytochrome c family protein